MGVPVNFALAAADVSPHLINILIVDDEPKNLAVLEAVLDDPGYRLVRAASADQALLALVAQEFAVLILDIRMPEMNGLELAQMIKDRKRTSRVPIIFLTAYLDEDQHVLDGYDSGAVDVLHKPVNSAILRSKVAVFADLHRKTRELELANCALQLEVQQRRDAEQKLVEFNQTLEQRVVARTHELNEADRRKNVFLATLAHELRNPLAPIRTAAQLLESPVLGTEGVERCRAIIARQVAHMAVLLDDLLDIARFTSGELTLRKTRVALRHLLDTAVETAQPLIDGAHHRLRVHTPAADIMLEVDAVRFSQIIGNLLANAAKYMDDGGLITLDVRIDGSGFEVIVRDEGIGFPAEMRDRIFDMFVQAESAKERALGGLGIGLALVKALVQLHGGTITADSAGRNQGSTFTVKLPRATVIEDEPAAAQCRTHEAPSAGSRRILIADDNEDGANALGMLLELSGHEVHVVYSGTDALASAERVRPDVAVLDIGMPGMDGYDVAGRIRAASWGRRMQLIAVTGWGQRSDQDKARQAGFDHHLTKPMDPVMLENLLGRK